MSGEDTNQSRGSTQLPAHTTSSTVTGIRVEGQMTQHNQNCTTIITGGPPQAKAPKIDMDKQIESILKTIHQNTWEKTETTVGDTFTADRFPEPDFEVHLQMIESPDFYKGGHPVVENISTQPNKVKQPDYKKDHRFTFKKSNVESERSLSDESLMEKIHEKKGKLGVLGVVAQAGAGKTTCMRRWARRTMIRSGMSKENEYTPCKESRFRMVHFMDMKDIPMSEISSLQEFLFKDLFEDEECTKIAYKWLLRNQNQVVIFLDGLDQVQQNITEQDLNLNFVGNYGRANCSVILCNLFTRKLLPGVRFIISSREHAAASLPEEAWFHDVITLTGFPEDTKQKSELLHRQLQILQIIDASIDNNGLIDLSESMAESTQSERKLPVKMNEISPNNCFGITVLAKRVGDVDLLENVNNYVMENFKMISVHEAFNSLSMKTLKTYLVNCDLYDTMRLDLIEAKLSISGNIQPSGEMQESDLDFVKFLATVSTNYRNIYPKVRTYCHIALRRALSDMNCLETAIFAATCRLDELQVWAEHYVIANFYSVSVTSYPKKVISKFCEISSIPIRMQETLKGQSGPSYKKSRLEDVSSEWLLNQLRKLSSVKTKTIGVEGGVIELDGCSVTFPGGALTKETKITMSVNTDQRNYPESGKAITPILSVEPSMVFDKQVTVKLPTCFSARDGQTLTVQLMSSHGSEWELNRDIELSSVYEISFQVSHFSDDVVVSEDTSNGMSRFLNDIFIQINTGMITSHFYRFEKDEKDLKKVMRARNCSSFCTRTLTVEGNVNELIRLDINLKQPKEVSLSHDLWRPERVTMGRVQKEGSFSFNVDPDGLFSSLHAGPFIRGEYRIILGSSNEPADSAWVKREWPVTLDPERIDAPSQLIAHKYITEGGVVHEHNKQCKTVVAGKVQ